MISPVDTLLRVSGEPVLLITPFVGDATAYDAASTTDFAPALPQETTVDGIWSDGYAEGFEAGEVATVLIGGDSLPDHLTPMISTLDRRDKTYKITRWRERVYLGETDGYNLFLAT